MVAMLITRRFDLKASDASIRDNDFCFLSGLQLWEESQKENSRLREDISKLKDDLGTSKRKLDAALHVSCLPHLKVRPKIIQNLLFSDLVVGCSFDRKREEREKGPREETGRDGGGTQGTCLESAKI